MITSYKSRTVRVIERSSVRAALVMIRQVTMYSAPAVPPDNQTVTLSAAFVLLSLVMPVGTVTVPPTVNRSFAQLTSTDVTSPETTLPAQPAVREAVREAAREAAGAPAKTAAAPAASDETPSHTLEEFLAETGERDNPGDVFDEVPEP